LTSDLARIPGLVVISREKLLRVGRPPAGGGEAPADALEVGRLLGCRWIVSGSFQRLGPVVRITTGLTDVGTGHVVAGEKLDGSIEGIFELQDRLSRTVAASLHLRVPTGRRLSPGERDVEAFEYHARARRLWQRLEKGTLEQAGDLYRWAIDLESTHAQALSGLAALHAMRFTFTTSPEELRTAAEYARRAIAADPRLAEPHVWLGYALMREDRLSEALDEFEQASELDPALVFAPYFAGCVEIFRGRPDEALPPGACANTSATRISSRASTSRSRLRRCSESSALPAAASRRCCVV
jgi:adenylate cyclase